MATREAATMSANLKRMERNDAEMRKPLSQQRNLETLKRIPRGKAAQQQWRPSGRKSSGRS